MIHLNIIILALTGAGAWWLTGFDRGFDGQGRIGRYVRRVIRTVLALLVVSVLLWAAETHIGPWAIPILIICPIALALLLRSSVAEVFAFSAAYDLQKMMRFLGAIGQLIKTGQQEQAIKLCEEFEKSGEIGQVTLETTPKNPGVKAGRSPAGNPLSEPHQLRSEGRFIEAVPLLKSMLERNPRDTEAAILLMRLYVQDLHQRGLADEVLRQLEEQPQMPAAQIEFARRSLNEWGASEPARAGKEPAAPVPDSIDEALARGFVGTAIQRLEEQILDHPADIDLRLKLMEIQAVHCQNLQRANKMLRDLASDPHFSAQQVEMATLKVRNWHIAASKTGRLA